MERRDTRELHVSIVLAHSEGAYQGVCSCSWTSTFASFEEADLLRAMHAHAVVTFASYQ